MTLRKIDQTPNLIFVTRSLKTKYNNFKFMPTFFALIFCVKASKFVHSTSSRVTERRSKDRDLEPQPDHVTFVEIDHKIISTSADSRRAVTGVSMCTLYWLTSYRT